MITSQCDTLLTQQFSRVFLKLMMLCFTLMWVNTKHIDVSKHQAYSAEHFFLCFHVWSMMWMSTFVYVYSGWNEHIVSFWNCHWSLSLVIVIGHCSFWRLLDSGFILQFAPFPNSTHPNFSKRGRIFLSQISSSRISPISFLGFFMWVKQCHKPPMTGGW